MRVKVTNICSEDVLPALRSLAVELEKRMGAATNDAGLDVDQVRFNTVSISDDEEANKKFAKANEKFGRFKDQNGWQRELSLSLIFDPRKVNALKQDDLVYAWVQQMEARLSKSIMLPGGINPQRVLALVRSAL